MGISEITFLQTEKTERKFLSIEKIQRKAIAAGKQSLRLHFPKINDLVKLSEFLQNIDSKTTFLAHCNENLERINLKEINSLGNYTFLIGPEGDFSEKEIELLASKNIKAVSLGDQRLRTETAGVFVAAWNYLKMI
jgi:16S rRNA (uracil1498-N3)-methyltransferase